MTRLLGLLLTPFLLAGCSHPACPTTPHDDAARALRMHRSLRRTVHALRAEARVDQRGERGRIRGTVLMYLERPDRVRFDAMTQFGPVAVLTSDGSSFQLFDQREERFLEGPACPANIERLLGIAMSGEDVARLLMGDTPRLTAEEMVMACGDEGYHITIRGPDGRRQEIILAPRAADRDAPPERQHLRLRRSTLFHADGRVDWSVSYDDFQVVVDPRDPEGRGVAFPFRVRFEDPDAGADTLVRIKEVEILPSPPAREVFRQRPPAGLAVEQVQCE